MLSPLRQSAVVSWEQTSFYVVCGHSLVQKSESATPGDETKAKDTPHHTGQSGCIACMLSLRNELPADASNPCYLRGERRWSFVLREAAPEMETVGEEAVILSAGVQSYA